MQLRNSAPPLLLAALLSAIPALARTDLEGCISTEVIIEKYYASYIWYVPDTGELCSFLDCGGGRAPPKTTKPGCGGYTGTETVTPDYLPEFGTAKSTATAAEPTVVISTTQAETTPDSSSSDADAASPTTTEDSAITQAPSVSVSGVTVVTSTTSSPGSTSSSSNAPVGGNGSSSSSPSSSASSTSVSTAAASGQTGISRSIVGVIAGVVGGLSFL